MSQITNTHGKGKTYWRSLEELEGTPEFQTFLEREFPTEASEWVGESRRGFLKIMAASIALAGLVGCRRWPKEKVVEYARRPENRMPGVPVHYATATELSGVGVGLVATSYDGRPVKLDGQPNHPLNMGASDAYQQAALLGMYDPDRSLGVIKRDKPGRGAHADPSGWEQFSKEIPNLMPAQGQGLYILSEASNSPSVIDLRKRLLAKYPQTQWLTYEPVGSQNELEGLFKLYGQPLRAVYQLDKAKIIVTLDADLFNGHPLAVKYSRDFAAGRRLHNDSALVPSMNRMYAVEPMVTTTGAAADHRLAVPASWIESVADDLYTFKDQGFLRTNHPVSKLVKDYTQFLNVIGTELIEHPGECVVVAGARQSPAVHALVAGLNQALGNVGKTVEYYPTTEFATGVASLQQLVADAQQGKVKTLVILGGNPVYTAPGDVDFAGALAKVGQVVRLGTHDDETSEYAHWHVAQAHFLEAWGDTRTFDGTVSITQPLIEPMFNGKSVIELLALLVDGTATPGYDLVQRTLKAYGVDSEWKWKRALFEGYVKDTAVPAVAYAAVESSFRKTDTQDVGKYQVIFQTDAKVYDGRFANNGWLQELPDPITRITWGNAAQMAPKTASDLGVKNDQVVRITVAGKSVELPTFIVPGMAHGTIAVNLGYGRTKAGNIGDGVGVNVYPLMQSGQVAVAAEVTATTGKQRIASVQDHHAVDWVAVQEMARRVPELVREGTFHDYLDKRDLGVSEKKKVLGLSLFNAHPYDGYKWGMAIDLTTCTGCSACVVACQSENNIPIVGREQVIGGREMHWLRIDRYFTGDPEQPDIVHQPVMCVHCENAPCEQVCPVAATTHSHEGLNMMTYNRCIGTRYCSNNCPYKVRRFNFFDYNNGSIKDLYTPNLMREPIGELQRMAKNPEVTVRSRGVMEKCTFCVQRIEQTRILANKEGRRKIADGEIVTACQQACPTQAIVFGDLNDPNSKVTQMHGLARTYGLLDFELNTKPRAQHLTRIRNVNEMLVPEATTAPASPVHEH
ncbi:MAG: TAT-variant-translocated molybdopterin oxidoreductase [Phycisphaerae bacterium]